MTAEKPTHQPIDPNEGEQAYIATPVPDMDPRVQQYVDAHNMIIDGIARRAPAFASTAGQAIMHAANMASRVKSNRK